MGASYFKEGEAESFMRGRVDRMGQAGGLSEADLTYMKELTGGFLDEKNIKWETDAKFECDGKAYDLADPSVEGRNRAREALYKSMADTGIKEVADLFAAQTKTTPKAIRKAKAKKEASMANAQNHMGDGPTEKDPVKKAFYETFVFKLALATSVTIGAMQLVAEGQKGCYLVDKDGIYRTKIPSLSGCSDAIKAQCNCLNADVASACQAVCPGITGDCTEESAKKCLCPGWTIAHRCPEFWDVATSIAAEIGLIIDDVGNLVDSALASGADFMKYFWWVLIGFAALVAIVLAVVLFRKLSGAGKSRSKSFTITE